MFVRNRITLEQLRPVAEELMAAFPGSRIFAFFGIMGSGKTTFIQEICKSLQSDDIVTSPTFAIINEYNTLSGEPVFHFDFYRIKNLEEVFDLGYEDYFFSGNFCLIEWPERIEQLLPDQYIEVTITADGDLTRNIIARSVDK